MTGPNLEENNDIGKDKYGNNSHFLFVFILFVYMDEHKENYYINLIKIIHNKYFVVNFVFLSMKNIIFLLALYTLQ